MKTKFQFIAGVVLMFLFLIPGAQAQILQEKSDVIKEYGEPFSSGVTKSGENYLFYKMPVTTKASGTYNQGRVLYFKTFSDGSEVCYKFKVVEPLSETIYNITSFTRNLVQIEDMQWKDYAKGIVYNIKEVKGVCLITAEYDNEVSLAKVYKF
ncbi:hypothetical protein FK178_15190 [Antarcticibacterium arcticum]|uniref:Uncharacterized protein n=1 Tax=Antarcticibacterium arcticum TaxID=2585771 RepID=A0A5B8YPZ3_9FLAO|nr:hypothetical protein [Antarcticibacterium arcticum]QED38977.1 hypothetical protein FK178_15190 [Antarcticibacterium arcticum]